MLSYIPVILVVGIYVGSRAELQCLRVSGVASAPRSARSACGPGPGSLCPVWICLESQAYPWHLWGRQTLADLVRAPRATNFSTFAPPAEP